jgi:hypothetical protein
MTSEIRKLETIADRYSKTKKPEDASLIFKLGELLSRERHLLKMTKEIAENLPKVKKFSLSEVFRDILEIYKFGFALGIIIIILFCSQWITYVPFASPIASSIELSLPPAMFIIFLIILVSMYCITIIFQPKTYFYTKFRLKNVSPKVLKKGIVYPGHFVIENYGKDIIEANKYYVKRVELESSDGWHVIKFPCGKYKFPELKPGMLTDEIKFHCKIPLDFPLGVYSFIVYVESIEDKLALREKVFVEKEEKKWKVCSKCKFKIYPGSIFCGGCGRRVGV